jgi:hypothetical protein
MCRSYILAVAAFALLCGHHFSFAQWVQTNGPAGGNIQSLAVSGSIVFVGAGYPNYGVFCSTDNGQTWTSPGLVGLSVSSIASSGTSVFAGLSYPGSGVYRSTDIGKTWTQSGLNGINIRTLAANGSNIFAGGGNSSTYGVYRSTDNGTTWVQTGLNVPVQTLAINGSNIFAGKTSPNGRVYRSTDNGETWTESGLDGMSVYSLAINGNTVFAGIIYPSAGIYRSTDNGQTWNQSGLSGLNVSSITAKGDTVFAFAWSSRDLYRSTDNGVTWALLEGLHGMEVSRLAAEGSRVFAGLYSGGVQRSTNGGQDWQQMPLKVADVGFLSVSDSMIFSTADVGIYRSTNEGQDWTQMGFGGQHFVSVASSGSRVFAATYGAVYRSLDNGVTWTPAGSLGDIGATCVAMNSACVFAGGGDTSAVVYVSTNDGDTWTRTLSMPYFCSFVSSFAVNGSEIFVGLNFSDCGVNPVGTGSVVYRSTDNGLTWTPTGLNNQNVTSLATDGSQIIAGTGWCSKGGCGGEGIFMSIDHGNTWTQVTTLGSTYVTSVATRGSNIFAGTNYGYLKGVHVSTDNGQTWARRNEGLENLYINSLAITNDQIYAGTYHSSVWKRSLSELITSVEGQPSELPTQFKLEQNYPNPFNPSTVIRFSVPSSKFVTLKVYNALGQEVATLVNEVKQPGRYEVTWDASGMASGVYLYRMQAGGYIDTKKLILLK